VPDQQHSVHMVAASVGFTSFGFLWLAVVWGIVLRSGWGLSRIRHATIYGIHMTVTLFAFMLGWVHGIAQLAAPRGHVRVIDEWAPFVNPVDRFGIGFGVLGLEIMTALLFSVLIQRRLGYRRWKRLHSLAHISFAMIAAHILISGSDTRNLQVRAIVAGAWAFTVLVWLVGNPRLHRIPQLASERIALRLRGGQATVHVDPGRCARFGFCEQEAPDVFRLRSDGQLAYRPTVPADQVEEVVQAARVCPMRAIELGRRPTTVFLAPVEQQNNKSRPDEGWTRVPAQRRIPVIDHVEGDRPEGRS
jgi:ferredoxin/DMSO/TMAO reductase YedYZ heme-binding membrane subunit